MDINFWVEEILRLYREGNSVRESVLKVKLMKGLDNGKYKNN